MNNKETAVAIMVEFINNQNRLAAAMQPQNTPGAKSLAEIEKYISDMQPQLNVMCSGIYDALAQKNLINIG